ncbi:MAG TPA: DUF1565 domain-containing protein [Candidatus Deferrimicrobiaceae bacterium]
MYRRCCRLLLPVLILFAIASCSWNDGDPVPIGNTGPTAPAAPVATATPGNAQATVTWDNVPGALSYRLNWSASAGQTNSNGTAVVNVTSPCVVDNLVNGTTYYFVVTAINAAGGSPGSAPVSARPVAPVPPAFTVDAATGNDNTGNGTTIPYKTITKALSVAVAGDNVTVAPGTYNSALGETFPIVIPAGVKLIGDEANKGNGTTPTTITGGGAAASPVYSFVRAAVVMSDNTALAGFLVTGTAPDPVTNPPMGVIALGDNVSIRNNRLVNSGKGGLYWVSGGNGSVVAGNVIQGNGPTNNGTGISFINGTGPGVRIENNVIRLNVIGVDYDAPAASGDLGGGATGSAGGNVIAANSSINLWTNIDAGSTISARNNAWSNVPPTSTSSSSASGFDIYNQYGATIDTTGATLAP